MSDDTIDLDKRRGMAAQKETRLRRLHAEVREQRDALRARQDALEEQLVAAPAESWEEAAEKARRGLPFRTEAALAKLIASEGGGRVVDRSMQIHGGMGMTKDLPLERWYREMRIRRVGEGPSEVQRMVVAREILGSNLR